MKLTAEVQATYQRLSTVNTYFQEFVEKEPGALKRASFKSLELNHWLFKLQPWPTFINPGCKAAFRDASEKIFKLIKTLPKRIFGNDPHKISTYYGIPTALGKLQLEGLTDDHLEHLIGRGDFILSSSGLKCIEYNVSPNLGGMEIPLWESLYLNNPIIAKFLAEYHIQTRNQNLLALFLEHLIDRPLTRIPNDEAELNIAIVVKDYIEGSEERNRLYLDSLFKQVLKRKKCGRQLKGNVFMCDYHHLTSSDHWIYYRGRKIHIVVELYNGVVSPEVMAAFKSGNLQLFNGPATALLSNKLNLALLSEHENSDIFNSEERQAIKKYIPWTRKLTADQGDFLISNKDQLVIKQSVGLGGESVYIGQSTPAQGWRELVKNVLEQKNWLVQEVVEPSTGLYQVGGNGCAPHHMVFGFLVFGSRYAGVYLRVSPKKEQVRLVNAHQGAMNSIVFEVDE